ncbi:unnamed protein product [Malus baccata var. baccata]
MVIITGSPPTLLLPTKLLTFPSKNKSTLCWEGTNNGSHTNQSNPNSTPAAKVHAKVFPKGNVIVASKEDDDKTDAPAAPTKKMPQHPNMESAKYDGVYDMFRGRLDESGFVFQQNFAIRSYELGPDGKATMTCLMERLQETSVQHCRSIGLLVGGFGSSLEMSKRGQVWVVRKLQAIVDKYPSWADVIQVDSWSGASGNSGMFRDWIFRDYITGEILMRATGLYVLMNIKTRKVGRLTEEIKQEFKPYFVDSDPLIDINSTKLGRLNVDGRDYVQTGLAPPRWHDLDINQHVSHAKYIDWVLESIPILTLESHELSSMTLEFRRECRRDSVLQSLRSTGVARDGIDDSSTYNKGVEFDHLLRLEAGSEIFRAKTVWRPK